MNGIYGKVRNGRPPVDVPVDAGEEEKLLKKRFRDGEVNGTAPARSTTVGGRPYQARTLLSEMKTYEKVEEQSATATQSSQRTIRRQPEQEAEAAQSSTRPARATRTRKQQSQTPEPLITRYSKTTGLGKPWDQPITYPEVGKKRVTVDFSDLERLDEGEFLNDNLIEFYMRWLRETRTNVKSQTAYFFGTHFYTTLAETKSAPRNARNRNINYQAVERWTNRDDIFAHDFVVVPINEMAHWYLAIICNLPNVRRKLEGLGDEEDEDEKKGTKEKPLSISDPAEPLKGTKEKPFSISDPVEAPRAADPASERREVVDVEIDQKMASDASDANGTATKAQPENAQVKDSQRLIEDEDTSPTQEKPEATKVNDSQTTAQQDSQASVGVFGNAGQSSPEKKKKGKRKSGGPVARKYETSQPAIVILDPMGTSHPGAITRLKEYLVEEASTKRGMAIDKNMFQGMNARKGIPQQNNYYDCGIFVCGYLDKFMGDPMDFGRKLLSQEFDVVEDWPEMKPSLMRAQMREMLQAIAKDQQQARLERKAAKRAAKKEAAVTSNPTKAEQSVAEPERAAEETSVQGERSQQLKGGADVATEVEKARSRTSKSPVKSLPTSAAATTIIDREGPRTQLEPDFSSQLEAAAGKQPSQTTEEDYISDSQSDVEREPGGVEAPDQDVFTIFEDEKIEVGSPLREPPASRSRDGPSRESPALRHVRTPSRDSPAPRYSRTPSCDLPATRSRATPGRDPPSRRSRATLSHELPAPGAGGKAYKPDLPL
jgi:Ulp1 family protease